MTVATRPTNERQREEALVLTCPHCGQFTKSLKCYRVFDYLVFLFVAFSLQTVWHTACPRCMRKSLTVRTLLNLIPANFVWPMLVIAHGLCFLASYTDGHSRTVLRIIRGQG